MKKHKKEEENIGFGTSFSFFFLLFLLISYTEKKNVSAKTNMTYRLTKI
jgi:hypothetical protein